MDVFLWGFFEDCKFRAWWAALAAEDYGVDAAGWGSAFEGRLREEIGCVAELKELYVAVTRARSRLFFIDTDEQGRAPFYAILLKTKFAVWYEGDQVEAGGLSRSSTKRQWRASGDKLLQHVREGDEALASQAARCFLESGDVPLEAYCRGVQWRRDCGQRARDEDDESALLQVRLAAACAFARGGALDDAATELWACGDPQLDALADECASPHHRRTSVQINSQKKSFFKR